MATAKKTAPKKPSTRKFQAKVRMYRQGLGDCFLITLPQKSGKPFYILIDCGVILGTAEPKAIMTKVVEDIVETTSGKIDILAATHEHWDHISGFNQARESFAKLKVGDVWLGWTEDPGDSLAKKLRRERHGMRAALATAETRMRFGGAHDDANQVRTMLEFFGAAGASTADALEFVRGMSGVDPRFCLPTDPPQRLGDTGAVAYVLGPPHDERAIKKFAPSKKTPETYGLDSANLYLSAMTPALTGEDSGQPFDAPFQIPLDAARQNAFFQDHYWGEDRESEERDQSWRAIDAAWLSSSSELALQLDSATNNTSLVIAIELDGGRVLLFAADAQVGNWLSWQDLEWQHPDGGRITGPELLARTVFYKVGHHGSHNATLKEKGLETMKNLEVAMVPVDREMAEKKGWGKIPLTELLERLEKITDGRVVRSDEKLPGKLKGSVAETGLFYELTL